MDQHPNPRQQQLLSMDQSGDEILIHPDTSLPIEAFLQLHPEHPLVVQSYDSGLTAHVYKVNWQGQDLCVKLKRSESLVRNIDGQVSFLTEVLRRRDLTDLMRHHRLPVVKTLYGSYRQGILVSEWAEGECWQEFDQRRLQQLFDYLCLIYRHGLFDWDLCAGNIVSDGEQIWLYDFGYMYTFDPLREYNSDGLDGPLFHPVERFETRNLSGYLLKLELLNKKQKALDLFRLVKRLALQSYESLYLDLTDKAARPIVCQRLVELMAVWRQGLESQTALDELYQLEMFRSHVLDVADDLHGQSCSPQTLQRLDKILDTVEHRFLFLQQNNGLFFGDEEMDKSQLIAKYQQQRVQAQRYQLSNAKQFT